MEDHKFSSNEVKSLVKKVLTDRLLVERFVYATSGELIAGIVVFFNS